MFLFTPFKVLGEQAFCSGTIMITWCIRIDKPS